MAIEIRVLFFGPLREIAGCAEESASIADGAAIEELFAQIGRRHPEVLKYRPSLVASRNREFAPWDSTLKTGDEVAFLPPVSGG